MTKSQAEHFAHVSFTSALLFQKILNFSILLKCDSVAFENWHDSLEESSARLQT